VEKSIWTEEYRQLCVLLQRLRREAGLTQVEVAERLDVPQSFVSKYESGERRLDVIELRHVAEAIETTLDSIVAQLR
jgi:transcriptional regulator with XRE-family HTH domain